VRVRELSLRNYRVFEQVDLELPGDQVIGIFGANGSGKSSLVESIAFALYGVDAARTKKNEIRTQGLLTDCEVRMVFEHGGQHYEVRRSIRGKGHTPEAELYVGGLVLAAGTTEVEAEVRRLLHMDLRVFRASVFAEQKQLDAFSDVTPGKRKEMALRLLGIRPVDDARTAARREARSTKQSADLLAGAVADIAVLETALKEAADAIREAVKQQKATAGALKDAVKREQAARKVFQESDRVRERVEKITLELRNRAEERDRLAADRDRRTERIEALEKALAELSGLEEELAALGPADQLLPMGERFAELAGKLASAREQLAGLPKADAAQGVAALDAAAEGFAAAETALAETTARRDHGTRLLAEAQDRLTRASQADPAQPCPTCGRPLEDDFAGYVRHCREQVTEAKLRLGEAERAHRQASAKRSKAEGELRRARRNVEAVQAAAARRRTLLERVEELERDLAAAAEPFGGAAPDLDALGAGARRVKELEKLLAQLQAQRPHLDRETRDLAVVESTLAVLDGKIQDLADEAEGLSFDPPAHARLRAEWQDAETAVEAAREADRAAAHDLAGTEKRAGELSGRLEEARETEHRAGELRSEAAYLERTGMLLDGFRDHLVARVGPELSGEAEALFRDLTNREYDDLRIDDETLSIQIADGEAYHPIERFSGSETDLANLALRVAISAHLSRVSGADLGTLVLDEVLASLDVERKDLFVQAMGRLSNHFHQLFVITHAEQVKDQFPAAIEVRKVGRRRSQAALV
jgi:exonuclease SbcC